jgi:Integrase core domain
MEVERFHKTVLDEFYRVAFRKKNYGSIAELQTDLDSWVQSYNEERPHQGRWCFGKTPMQTFLDATPLTNAKMIAAWSYLTGRADRSPDTDRQIKRQRLHKMTLNVELTPTAA